MDTGVWQSICMIGLLLLIPLQALPSMLHNSINGDEVYSISSGYSKLKTGDYRLAPEFCVLVPIISALPLLLTGVNFPFDDASWKIKNMDVLMPKFIFEYNQEPYKIIFLSRLPMILLSMLLGFYVYTWARRLYGRGAGLFALFLYVFSTDMLAHGQIVSVDFGFAVFCFIALYHFWAFCTDRSAKNLVVAGITLGLALITRTTAIFLIPIYFLLAGSLMIGKFFRGGARDEQGRWAECARVLRSTIAILFIAYLVILVSYGFEGFLRPIGVSMKEDIHLNKSLFPVESMYGGNRLIKTAMDRIPSPLPYYYVRALGHSISNTKSQVASLIVDGSPQVRWYYFLLSFLLKTQLPLLLLLALALLIYLRTVKRGDTLFLLVPFLFFHLAFCFTAKQFGYRYVIHTVPFLFVFVAGLFNLRRVKQGVLPALKVALVLLSVWYLCSSLMAYPHYLSYYNELIGGPLNGYKYFVESNTDWGQDLFYLADYVHKNNISNISLAYYGFPVIVGHRIPAYYGIDYTQLGCGRTEGMIAISISPLMRDISCYGWLQNETIVGRIGYTIIAYNVTATSNLS